VKEEGKNYTLHRRLPVCLPPVATHRPEKSGENRGGKEKCAAENDPNRAGAPPLFGLSAAQKVLGVAPALRQSRLCRPSFFRRRQEIKSIPTGGKPMSIIKKAPAILNREFRLEEPVSLLLDDYAQFIESSPDHVLNSAIKKTLWRDQEYRKWREQKRNGGSAARPSDAAAKA